MFWSGFTTLIISNKDMNDIMKIIKFLEESGLLIKGVSETTKTEAKQKTKSTIFKLLRIFRASLLGNLLTGKGAIETSRVKDASSRRS